MKILVPRSDFVALIGKLQGVISSKPVIPILSNVLLEASNDQLVISATDLMVSMRAYIEAKVLEEGAITLPARKLFQLVRELTVPHIEIETPTPETAIINAGSSRFKIQGMHKTEFPALPDLSTGTSFSVAPSKLKELLTRSAFAAATDDDRQVLNGICLSYNNGMVTVLATDGKKLAKLESSMNLPSPLQESYIIPRKAVDEMVKILDEKQEEEVKVTLLSDKISVEAPHVTLISKLLSGPYPDLSRAIPVKSTAPLSLHREELMALLRQVSLFTSDENCQVKFTFTPGSLHLSATTGEVGEGKVSMPVNYAGPKLDIAFNPHTFIEILRSTKDEAIQFTITDSFNPGLVTDSTNAYFMIMPMRFDA